MHHINVLRYIYKQKYTIKELHTKSIINKSIFIMKCLLRTYKNTSMFLNFIVFTFDTNIYPKA